jgi:acyl carrier protein
MAVVTDEISKEVTEIVYNFFSEECDVERDSLSDNTNVMEDIEGDSLMFMELLEIFKKKYKLNIDIKSIGKYVLRNPSDTIGKIIDLSLLIIEKENQIAEM